MKAYDLSGLSVLVLDRNAHMLAIMRAALRALGVERLWTTSEPEEAFQLFQANEIDLVMSDWVPGRDELKFLHRIRDVIESSDPYVPIIVVTAYTELPTVMAARDLGMTEFMATPVSVMRIYNHICSVIEHHRPFIMIRNFFGPDRRRHQLSEYQGSNRRSEVGADGVVCAQIGE